MSPRLRPWLLTLLLLPGCDELTAPPCAADGDCPTGDLCAGQGRCLQPAVAARVGPIGDACRVRDGRTLGCAVGQRCRARFCVGHAAPPDGGAAPDVSVDTDGGCSDPTGLRFAGPMATVADGDDALITYWLPANAAGVSYLGFVAEGANPYDFERPTFELRGATEARVTGLTAGVEYGLTLRARTADGGLWCPPVEHWVRPGGCVDFQDEVQPTLRFQCGCHRGDSPQRQLDLSTWQGARAGGLRGPAVIPCEPERSLLIQKLQPTPVEGVGERMPYGAPAPLPAPLRARLTEWIRQGAPQRCPPRVAGLCPDAP